MSVGIKTNPNYQCIAKSDDAMIALGEVSKDNVIAGLTARVGRPSRAVPHFVRMDKDGDSLTKGRQGTVSVCPGTFGVSAGEIVGEGIPGVFIDSNNGDLVLHSSGRIRLIAEDIDLIAKGSGEANGVIQINANTRVHIVADDVHIDAGNLTKIFSEKTTEVIGMGILNLYGKSIEQLDASASMKGSTGFIPIPWTPRELEQTIANMRRIFS